MFDKKEIAWIIIALILFEFIILFPDAGLPSILLILVPLIILPINLISKKIASKYFDISIEYKIWHFQRFWFTEKAKFKKPFPIGVLLPFLVAFVSLGFLRPLTLIQFDYKNNPVTRVLKRKGFKKERKTEINESDVSYTVAWGLYPLLLLAFISWLIGYGELASYSIYYGLWNLIPFGNLDGARLFFGSFINWVFVLVLFLIALPFVFFM
ncbi:hypothetical protein HOD75_02345 [archaeon]|jgi:hypothetical protein|nr:hypothetical protein [archaeon]MBT4241718.1 hypothetical protein [archaeon]MBT4418266.1 hypothetical protein [archaeon]